MLLAENQAGYSHLCRLLTLAHLGEDGSAGVGETPDDEDWPGKSDPSSPTAALSWEALAAHSGGLIALSGCRHGPIAAPLLAGQPDLALANAKRLLHIFGRRGLFVELQRHLLPDEPPLIRGLLDIAARLDLPLVATNNVHYAERQGHRLQDVMVCIRHLASLDEAGAWLRPNSEYYLKPAADMARLFPGHPQALTNTLAIAERCQVSLDFSRQRLPTFPVPDGHTPFSYLYQLCQGGLRCKYRPVTPAASKQLAYELDVIQNTGLAGYFLIVWDIVRYAQAQGIRYQGRGSAANSLVAYLLDITPVDPLRFHLLFERFLSPDSHTMPDIDIDFAADRREEVIQYVYRRYGREHTAMVCNVNTFRARSALRDVGRVLGLTPEMTERVRRREGGRERGGEGGMLFELCEALEGAPRHLSIHTGGMVITASLLHEVVPLERATMPGRVVIQWDKDSVEDAGLIKIDLLGLRTLGMVDEIAHLIEAKNGQAPPQPSGQAPPLDELALDDPAIYDDLCRGDTLGAFQVESRAQVQMLPRMRPRRFQDIVVEVAIVPAGPHPG